MLHILQKRTFYIALSLIIPVFTEEYNFLRRHPPRTTSELLSSITHTTLKVIADCGQPKLADILLLLYTRNNPKHSITLTKNNLFRLGTRRKIVLLIHGWVSDAHTYGFPDLKNAYLKRYDCNVIVVDWSIYGYRMYPTSVCFLPKIAQILANFLCLIRNQYGLSLNLVHLVGHSLGGQMSGIIGQHTKVMCKEAIGRITGMDPAGPLYQGLPISQRLDKSDANFVDVIHSNEGVLGYFGDCGHVDFYPNCGTMQPGCPTNMNISDVVDYPALATSCEHYRSVEFMSESVNSDNFKAKPCKTCPINCTPNQSDNGEVIMGEGCTRNTTFGSYMLETNSEPPYGKG